MLNKPSLSTLFATFLNLAIKVHPSIDTTTLDGHSFGLAIDELPQDIFIRVDRGRVAAVSEDNLADIDVSVSGSLKAILHMISHEEDGLESDELYIAGKMSTAKKFQHFLAGFSLDWQHFFAQFMSDEMAQKTVSTFEQGASVARAGVEQLGQGLKDYLTKEKALLVSGDELADFADELKQFSRRLERLSAKLPIYSNDS